MSEDTANIVERREGLARSTKPWVRKRPRKSTPPEERDLDQEGRFAEQEQRAEKKAMRDDVSYRDSSSEAEGE